MEPKSANFAFQQRIVDCGNMKAIIARPANCPIVVIRYDEVVKGKIEKSVIKNLEELMQLSSQKTAYLFYHFMYTYIPLVLAKLESNAEILFFFLKEAMGLKGEERGTRCVPDCNLAHLYVMFVSHEQNQVHHRRLQCMVTRRDSMSIPYRQKTHCFSTLT